MAIAHCPGDITTDVGGASVCSEAWESVPTFSVDQIDPEIATAAFASGFVIVGMAWAIGYGFRSLLDMIRR